MDDGYKDNYDSALPFFRSHGIPFTVFLATDFPNKKSILWWYSIEELLNNNDVLRLSDGSIYHCGSLIERNVAFENIRSKILKLNQYNLHEELSELFADYKIDWLKYGRSESMSWNEVNKLAQDPCGDIEGHTAHHYNLKALPNKIKVMQEIQLGIDEMKLHMNGFCPNYFAYPYGSPNEIGEREFDVASNMNFKRAFIGCGRSVNKNNVNNRFTTPRIALTENFNIPRIM